MKIKMSQILNLGEALMKLRALPLNIKAAYKLAKLAAAVQTEREFYDTKLREIVNEYAERDSQGQPITTENGVQIKEECLNEAGLKLSELYGLEVDLPDIKINLDELPDFNVNLDECEALLDFIEE